MKPSEGEETIEDPLLAAIVAEARADADTLGVLLHGSRAVDRQRPDSDYDLIRIVTEPAYVAPRPGCADGPREGTRRIEG